VATYTSGESSATGHGRPSDTEEEAALDLSLERRTHGTWAVVEVGGELDLYTAPSFRESVLEAAGDTDPPKVIVDFRQLGFIDSSGLGAIVACLKHLRERGGDLALAAPEGSGLRRLLDLTGLDRVLTLYASTDEIPEG
jgi:anti-sigma B factor antagonist